MAQHGAKTGPPANDYLKLRLFGLICLFQGVFWILFPFYAVPGALGVVLLILLVGLTAFFLLASYRILQKGETGLFRAVRLAAWGGLIVHGVLAFFCTDILFNFYFTPQQAGARFVLGFLLLALTSGIPGDLLLITLAPVLQKRVDERLFNPDRAAFRVANKRFETFEALFVALVLAFFIRIYFVQAFKIPSGSMEDTLLVGDHLLVNKFIYGTRLPVLDRQILQWRSPQRGDIIVFEFPQDAAAPYFQRRDFIKRVVGLPGDRVAVRGKQVFVNGERLTFSQEVYKEHTLLPPGLSPRDFMPELRVPEGQYFALGDNRDRSFDSRFWGFVDHDKIRGRAWIKYWSWDGDRGRPRWERIGRLIH